MLLFLEQRRSGQQNQRVVSLGSGTYDDLTSVQETVAKTKNGKRSGRIFPVLLRRFSHPLLAHSDSDNLNIQLELCSSGNLTDEAWDALDDENVHREWLESATEKLLKLP